MTVLGKPKGQAFSAWKIEPGGHYGEIKIPHRMHEMAKPFHDSILVVYMSTAHTISQKWVYLNE